VKARTIIIGLASAVVIGHAPAIWIEEAHADDWTRWDQLVAPMGPTAAVASIDAVRTRTYPSAGGQGTWQVYATPPGSHIIPSTETYCGTALSQAQIPATCPAGWDMWYR
jgi:hypothetical protein